MRRVQREYASSWATNIRGPDVSEPRLVAGDVQKGLRCARRYCHNARAVREYEAGANVAGGAGYVIARSDTSPASATATAHVPGGNRLWFLGLTHAGILQAYCVIAAPGHIRRSSTRFRRMRCGG